MSTNLNTIPRPHLLTTIGRLSGLTGFARATTPAQLARELPEAVRITSQQAQQEVSFGEVPTSPEAALEFKKQAMGRIRDVFSRTFDESAMFEPSLEIHAGDWAQASYAEKLGLLRGNGGRIALGTRLSDIMQAMVMVQHLPAGEGLPANMYFRLEQALETFGIKPEELAGKPSAVIAELPRMFLTLSQSINRAVEENILRAHYTEGDEHHDDVTHGLLLEAAAMGLISGRTFGDASRIFLDGSIVATSKNRDAVFDMMKRGYLTALFVMMGNAAVFELCDTLFPTGLNLTWLHGLVFGGIIVVANYGVAIGRSCREGEFSRYTSRYEDPVEIVNGGKTRFIDPDDVRRSEVWRMSTDLVNRGGLPPKLDPARV